MVQRHIPMHMSVSSKSQGGMSDAPFTVSEQQTASHPLVVKVDISVEQDMVAEDAKSVVNTVRLLNLRTL